MTLIISCMVALTHKCSRLDLFHYMVMRNRNMKATIWRPIFQHSSCSYLCMRKGFRVRVMVYNATFNNISVISRRSVLLLEENRVPGENHRPAASHWQTLGTDHLTWRGEGGWLWFFVSFRIFYSDNTRVRIFFLSRKARIFFPEFNIRLYDKNSQSDYFFSSTKIRIFFSATLGIRIFS